MVSLQGREIDIRDPFVNSSVGVGKQIPFRLFGNLPLLPTGQRCRGHNQMINSFASKF